MTPIEKAVNDAKQKFLDRYGFPADTIHLSIGMLKVLKKLSEGRYMEDFCGLEMRYSTKSTPHLEFWLSTTRNGKVYSVHARMEPGDAGAEKIIVPGETQL